MRTTNLSIGEMLELLMGLMFAELAMDDSDSDSNDTRGEQRVEPPSQAQVQSQDQDEGLPQQQTCIVCMENAKVIMCMPCNHVVYCQECKDVAVTGRSSTCPICRCPVDSYARIFM